jgi:hypothetical protein
MGLFDTVRCEYPLPDARHQDLEFQTKDLDCLLGHYTITTDRRLLLHAEGGKRGLDRDIEWPLHGDLRFYTSIKDSGESVWVEYVARFTHGRVEWIRPKEEVPPLPDIPPLELDWEPVTELLQNLRRKEEPQGIGSGDAAASGPEESLLLSLRRERHELETLLKRCSDHWGYEDPVYRFYHQSFKVYWLQQQTSSIVEKLQALAPDLPLNPWFVQVIESGTGKTFAIEDNARWTEVTRPILEAFFHARFFLEMAVRYADLQAPPQPLPSGYAALLYLFGIR